MFVGQIRSCFLGPQIVYIRSVKPKTREPMETHFGEKLIQTIHYTLLLGMAALGIVFFIIGLMNMAG